MNFSLHKKIIICFFSLMFCGTGLQYFILFSAFYKKTYRFILVLCLHGNFPTLIYVGNQSQPPQMAKFQQSRRTTQRKSWNTKIQKRRSILTLKTSWRTWAGQLIRQVNAKLNPIKLNNFISCKQNQDMKKRAKVRDLCFVVTYENLK